MRIPTIIDVCHHDQLRGTAYIGDLRRQGIGAGEAIAIEKYIGISMRFVYADPAVNVRAFAHTFLRQQWCAQRYRYQYRNRQPDDAAEQCLLEISETTHTASLFKGAGCTMMTMLSKPCVKSFVIL